jgi:hypothetical protein
MQKFYLLFGSPVKSAASAFGLGDTNTGNTLNTLATNAASNFLVNGFVNPLGYGLMTAFTQNPDNTSITDLESIVGLSDIQGTQNRGFAANLTVAYLKPRERPYDTVDAAGNTIGKFTARRAIKVFVLKREPTTNRSTFRDPPWRTINAIADEDTPTRETRYIVSVIDPSQFIPVKRDGESDNATGERILVTHDDLQPDLGSVFSPAALAINPAGTLIDAVLTGVDTAAAIGNLNVSSLIDNATDTGVKGFMSPENNAIVRSFEHNKGRGLAGVIKQLSFNWIDFNWETDWGARAPMGTKVTISFECIHDLPPGLDESGYMRAPTHNVGSIMNTIAGDPHDDGGTISRANFSRQGASNVVKK